MPYPNEHSCRVRNPGDFQSNSFRRKNIDNGVDIIIGRLKGKTTTTTQAYRFDASKFTVSQAKAWCKKNNVKCILFEPASGKKASDASPVNNCDNDSCEIDNLLDQKQIKHTNILDYCMEQPWLATEEAVRTIIDIISRNTDFQSVATKIGRPLENTRLVEIRDNIAIIPVNGTIIRYANLFHNISGGTSIQILAKDFNEAVENENVKAIVLNIDSPGGAVNGISEFADMIYEARNKKPIYAYVGGMAASAAYWIASATNKIIINDTAMLGSIGVVVNIVDKRKQQEKAGVKDYDIVSTKSPFKRTDPETDEGRKRIINLLDSIANVFITTVSKFRGVTTEKVENDFGKGDIFVGEKNIKQGLADEINSFENLITQLNDKYNNQGDFIMSDQNITKEFIETTYPEIASAFINEGAENERNRIKGIEDSLIPGHEKLIETMKFDGKTSPGEAAQAILKAEKEILKSKEKDLQDDASAIPETDNQEIDNEAKEKEQKEDEEAVGNMLKGAGMADQNKK